MRGTRVHSPQPRRARARAAPEHGGVFVRCRRRRRRRVPLLSPPRATTLTALLQRGPLFPVVAGGADAVVHE